MLWPGIYIRNWLVELIRNKLAARRRNYRIRKQLAFESFTLAPTQDNGLRKGAWPIGRTISLG